MNELIKIESKEIDNESVQTVNARELHAFLGVGKDFSTWIKTRIAKYGFEENTDYIIVENLSSPNLGSSKSRQQKLLDYYISIDMAKELAMVENNDKGREARKYFIECSNKADKILQAMSHLEYQPKTPYLFLDGNEYKTDSLTLSKVANKHHFHILRDIEEEILTLEENPNLDVPTKEYILKGFVKTSYISVQNKELPKYVLSEQALLQLLLKYSSEVRANFIKAFKEVRDTLNNIYKLKELEKILPEIDTNSSYVYIIKNMDTGNIKIGVSNDVQKRLNTFRTGNDCQLELVYKSVVCSNSFSIESSVHEYFKDYRVRGEWFKVNESEVIRFLECSNYTLKAQIPDVAGNGIFKKEDVNYELLKEEGILPICEQED